MKNTLILGAAYLAFAAINLTSLNAGAQTATAKKGQSAAEAIDKAELLKSFAEFYMPAQLSIDSALLNYDAQFIRASKADAASVALEEKYPGITENAMKSGRSIVERSLRETVPTIQLKIIAFMDARFTASEIAKINEFYATNASQTMQQQMLKNVDHDAMNDDLLKRAREGDGQFSLDNAQLKGALAKAAVKSMSKESITATSKFVGTPAGRKFLLNNNDLITILTSNLSTNMNVVAADVQTAVITSVQEYVAARP